MSNSTRPSGYDERLVVPLEASRRGAHRARVNPLLSVLPMLAVVVVVVAVIGVAYTLFMRGNDTADNSAAPGPTASAPAKSNPAASATSSGNRASNTPAPSAKASSAPAAVDKTVSFTVYNGSTAKVPGLAKKANTGLEGDGFAQGKVLTDQPPTGRTSTTKVYYATADQKAAAEAIQASLGVGTVRLSSSVAAKGIVVVIGDDYNS